MITYKPSDVVDCLVIGSGAAGGVVAKELSTVGFSVVVLEQGAYRPPGPRRSGNIRSTTSASAAI